MRRRSQRTSRVSTTSSARESQAGLQAVSCVPLVTLSFNEMTLLLGHRQRRSWRLWTESRSCFKLPIPTFTNMQVSLFLPLLCGQEYDLFNLLRILRLVERGFWCRTTDIQRERYPWAVPRPFCDPAPYLPQRTTQSYQPQDHCRVLFPSAQV